MNPTQQSGKEEEKEEEEIFIKLNMTIDQSVMHSTVSTPDNPSIEITKSLVIIIFFRWKKERMKRTKYSHRKKDS